MVIKKYIVSNMNEALSMIRNELGKEAVIITQRKVRKKGIQGLFSPKLIEVTAAVENSKKIKNTNVKDETDIEDSINSIKKIMEESISERKEEKREVLKKETQLGFPTENDEVKNLKNEISDIKDILNKALGNEEEKVDYLKELLDELDIDEEFYMEFKEGNLNINNKEEALEFIKSKIKNEIKVDTDEVKGKIVLVGPTGVGKTTTIAKLAGKLSLKDGKRVGLITVDTYRIGAVDQLKTYAEIMDIDFKVVLNGAEMEKAIEEMKDLDVVLIDSTGRSSKNIMQIKELKNLLSKANADSTYLVVSSTTKNKDLKNIIESYNSFDYDKVILTKLDETSTYGIIYNVQKLSNKKIRYLTSGQNVPDDIIDATDEKILKLLFLEESLC